MKLQVGVGSFGEMDYFLSEGADELYCGVSSVPSHVEGARNFSGAGEVLRAAAAARSAGVKMFFAANEVHAGLLKSTARLARELCAGGVAGVIVKDLALLDELARKGPRVPVILSTLSCCMNARALSFYRGLGVVRLALPEQLLPAEARELVRNPWKIGTEVFLKSRECCLNFNGLCFLDCHGGKVTPCRAAYRGSSGVRRMSGFSAEEHLGQLYDYHRLGVGVLKIGRSPCSGISKLIFKEASLLRSLLRSGIGREVFVKEALRVRSAFDKAYISLRASL